MQRAVLSQIKANYARLGSWDAPTVPLVLVHGLAASSAFWLRAVERLSQELSVLLFDLRGHGRSSTHPSGFTSSRMAEDLIELLDFLSLGRVVLAGHSFGGSIAMHVAIHCPDRVDALVLADTRLRIFQPDLTLAAWPQWRERGPHLRELGFSLDENEPEGGIRLLTEMARAEINCTNGQNLPRWIHEFFGQRQSRFTAARWIELVEKTTLLEDIKQEQWLSIEALRKLNVPLLGIYGENSPVAPSGRLLKEARPETNLRMVAGAGHFFPANRPSEFVQPVLDFVSEALRPPAQRISS
jgi:pimeloyl-ACP methyl ester carboxylesterase